MTQGVREEAKWLKGQLEERFDIKTKVVGMGGEEAKAAAMPLHYADKTGAAKRIKHESAVILGSVMCFQTWEATPESAYRQARLDKGNQDKIDKLLQEDAELVWKRQALQSKGFRLKSAKKA